MTEDLDTMFATVECEAAIFACPSAAEDRPGLLDMPGVDHVLRALPKERWGVLCHDTGSVAARFGDADLPAPPVAVACDGATGQAFLDAARRLEADPSVCLAFVDDPADLAAARTAGAQVVGIASEPSAGALDGADLVVPSLLSVRVLGTHPFIVLEVDALPGFGTGAARRR